jgi:hypothetical protein
MHKYFSDYKWENGRPVGIQVIDEENLKDKTSYKIVSDPYHKRISIEKYHGKTFVEIVYDSALFDFRRLKPEEQNAWHKTTIEETSSSLSSLIRDQDDRVILIEKYLFEEGLCRECRVQHPTGELVSVQKIFYTSLNDSFDGVILFDRTDRIVMRKEYEVDALTGEFSTLK